MNDDIEEKDKKKHIIYIGNDLNYWGNVQEKYREMYSDIDFEFESISHTPIKEIKLLIYKLTLKKYPIIYLDYTGAEPEMLRLANNVRREPETRDSAIIALLDSLDSKRFLTVSLSFGIYLNFIKSAELTSVIHHPMTIAFPEIAKDVDFALARASFNVESKTTFKIGYYTKEYVHLESNFEFDISSDVKMSTNIMIKPESSNNYKVIRKFDYNLYSNFDYSYDFEYDFNSTEEVEKIEKRYFEIESKLKESPKDHNLKYDFNSIKGELETAKVKSSKDAQQRKIAIEDFVENNQSRSALKKTRVLIYDREFRILHGLEDNIDSFNFSCRFASRPTGGAQSFLYRANAGIIAIQLDHSPDDEINEELVGKMIKLVKEYGHSKPLLVVFNTKYSTKELKEVIGYESVVGTSRDVDFSFIADAARTYEEKNGRDKTHDNQFKSEMRFAVSKYDPRSDGYLKINLNAKAICETDILFTSEVPIPNFTTLFVKYPVKMTITVVPPKAGGRMVMERGDYYGVISGLGEVELADLRLFVNKLFFLDHDQKKKDEAERALANREKYLKEKKLKDKN